MYMKNLTVCFLSVLLCFFTASCGNQSGNNTIQTRDLPQILQQDTLRVITMYGPISYFLYRDNQMGYEYELAKKLCAEMQVSMQLVVAPDIPTMLQWLQQGKGDLVAYRIPYTHQYKTLVTYTKQEYISNQVLVQAVSDTMRHTVLDLAGATITVPDNSIYYHRLVNLNDEIGGGIHIVACGDTITSDDLVAQVAMHKINYTITDDINARLNKTYFGNIDYNVDISFPQRSAWVVSSHSPQLLEFVNNWATSDTQKRYLSSLYHKYFQKSKYFEASGFTRIPQPGSISPFDQLFKEYAPTIQWDWRLLAAMAYKESKFNPDAMSWAGACGLMQLMPNTALSLGLDSTQVFFPEKNVAAATAYLQSLSKLFPGIANPQEKTKFVLAAYNAGPGHVFDARALATKYGKNPDVWADVREYMLKKSDPVFYADPVCRFGYCRGEEPVAYVDVIMQKYAQYKLWAK
jgi:membrane-bound lytic murein transglycosylase F